MTDPEKQIEEKTEKSNKWITELLISVLVSFLSTLFVLKCKGVI